METEDVETGAEEPRSRGGGVIGTLTAIGALITAIVGLLAGLRHLGVLGGAEQPQPSEARSAELVPDPQRPAPPPVEATSASEQRIVGAWTWPGQKCADGPHVTYEGQRLVFTTRPTRFVHRVLSNTAGTLRTLVIAPQEHVGDAYILRLTGDTLRVIEEANGAENVWTRCR